MLKTEDLIKEAVSLPVELRARLVDELLKSLNPSQAEIDELWAAEAERRIDEIESGQVKPIPGEQVFRELRKRLGR
jgi:putative addiction module component (TIGR02574 family)